MQPKSTIMLRILMNRYCRQDQDSFLRCLPRGDAQALMHFQLSLSDPTAAFIDPLARIHTIHYSWVVEVLKKSPPEVQQLFISSLQEQQAELLRPHLDLKLPADEIADPLKNYMIWYVLKNLTGARKVLPKEFLPRSSLTPLIVYSKPQLVELINFLSLHDLADEVRYILDQKTLKNIYACLSQPEQQYLNLCMNQRGGLSTPRMGLDRWSGNCAKLRNVLQTRGIVRLGKALSGEHPDLIWYLAHILDIKRGQVLIKCFSKETLPKVTPLLNVQVQAIMKLIKKKSTP